MASQNISNYNGVLSDPNKADLSFALKVCKDCKSWMSFLGPRGPLVLPLIGPARPSVRAKNLDHLYTGIYAL